MKTRLHINLHLNRIAITQKGLVVGYCDSATLAGCSIWENKKLADFSRTPGNKRTVHIAVVGELVSVAGFESLKGREVICNHVRGSQLYNAGELDSIDTRATYNPKRGDCGFMVDGEIWNGGEYCRVDQNGMFVG